LIGAWLFEDILLGPRLAARDFLSGGDGYVQASRPAWQRIQHAYHQNIATIMRKVSTITSDLPATVQTEPKERLGVT